MLLGCGQTERSAKAVIRARAAALDAPLYEADSLKGITNAMTLDGTDYAFGGSEYHIPLPGAYQINNANTVLHAVEILRKQGLPIPENAVKTGLSQVKWHGRFEILSRDPLILYDGAHNPDGIQMAKQTLDQYFPDQKAVFVIGVMADKAYAGYAEQLGSHMEFVCAVKPANPRALDAQTLAGVFSGAGIPAKAFDSVADGVQEALWQARKTGLPVIGIGSLYLYSEFCEALKKNL